MYNILMIDKRIKKVLYTKLEIEKEIKKLAQWVNETYRTSTNLVLVGLLKGSIPFLAQLIKDVHVDHMLDFMTVSSYSGGIISTGNLKMIMDLRHDIYNKDILIVEDIIDSGATLTKVVDLLKERDPNSIKVLTLMDKPEGRKNGFQADKVGFIVPNEFLVGFGLDVKDKMRNLPYVGIFDKSKIDEV